MLVYPLFIGTWELVLIILVIVLIFGGKKIPELMKGVGKGVKSFKEGISEVEEQINQADHAKPLAKPEEAPKSDETPKAE